MRNRREVVLRFTLFTFVGLAISSAVCWLWTQEKRESIITHVYDAQGVSKVIIRAERANEAIIETDPQLKAIEVSASAAGGARGYHSADRFWRETPASDWGLDFVSVRDGGLLIISSMNEIRYIHHHYFLGDLRIRVPEGVEVICQSRHLTGEGGPDLR